MGRFPLLHIVPAALALAALNSCAYGFIYSDITKPLVTDMRNTPAAGDSGSSATHEFREPFTRTGLSVQFASKAIGDAAKRNDIKTIYYADQRKISILGGIWRSTSVKVVGVKEP